MNDDEGIDFRKLEKELASAVEADAKYERENSAKFRAVEQRVASYEEFRDIVSASHLKPLERKDLTGEKAPNHPWNPHAHGKPQNPAVQSDTTLAPASKTPQTANEFSKVWRRQCKTELERYQLLLRIGGQQLQTIFKTEISMGLLGEFLLILNNCFEDEDVDEIVDILMQLSNTKRFDLSLKFLSAEEKCIATNLIKKLGSELGNETSNREGEERKIISREHCQKLGELYGVTL